jgi:hypothetical protein
MTRLEEEAIDLALVDGAHRGLEIRLARQDHPDRVGPLLADFRQELASGHARHAFVGDDDVDVVAGEDHEAFLGRVCREDLELGPIQAAHERRGQVRFVVHQQ